MPNSGVINVNMINSAAIKESRKRLTLRALQMFFSDIKRRTAYIEGTGYNDSHLTSSIGTKGYIVGVGTSGEFVSISISSSASFRPAIVLPADFPVINTLQDSLPAVMPVTPNPGIYVYAGGEWRECALL